MNQAAVEIAPEATESVTPRDTKASSAFILHCGGDFRSSSYIRNLPTPAPKGPQHVPVPYGLFAAETAGALRRHGYSMEAGSIGGSKWKEVLGQFEEPNHVEHLDAQGNPTVDTLENAFTEAFKGYHYASIPERSRKLCPVLDELAGFHPVVGNVIDLD